MRGCVLILSALLAAAAFKTPAGAQITRQDPPSAHAVTPAEMDKRLEEQAADTKKIAPRAARVALVDFAWPMNLEEYRATAKFIVVLVVAVSQQEQELPLKRVYVQAGAAPLRCRRSQACAARSPRARRLPACSAVSARTVSISHPPGR
jgi:hypothetical protein